MNLTISIDDRLLEQARELARRRGVSLQDLLRSYVESLVGEQTPAAAADELLELMHERGGRSGGRRITRDEAYEGRV